MMDDGDVLDSLGVPFFVMDREYYVRAADAIRSVKSEREFLYEVLDQLEAALETLEWGDVDRAVLKIKTAFHPPKQT